MWWTWRWASSSAGPSGPSSRAWWTTFSCRPSVCCWGGVDFSDFFLLLKEGAKPGPYNTLAEAQAAGAVSLNFGLFLNAVISFIIVAFALFMLIKGMNRLRREQAVPVEEPTTKDCPFCHTAIPIPATRCPNCTSQL